MLISVCFRNAIRAIIQPHIQFGVQVVLFISDYSQPINVNGLLKYAFDLEQVDLFIYLFSGYPN